jgi:hypothetical protein
MAVIVAEIAPTGPTCGNFNAGVRRALRQSKVTEPVLSEGSIVPLGDILQWSKKIQKNCL